MTKETVCEVGVGERERIAPCGEPAPYLALRWGWGPDSAEICCCPHHAWHALDDGAIVIGPAGHPCRLDDDGEIFEAQP